MDRGGIVFLGDSPRFARLTDEIASTGRDARRILNAPPLGAGSVLVADLRGRPEVAQGLASTVGDGLLLAWLTPDDLSAPPYTWGIDDFFVGEPVAAEIIARADAILRIARSEHRAADRRFSLLARAMDDAVWDLVPDEGVIVWSAGLNDQFGYQPGPGRTYAWWTECLHPQDRPRVIANFDRALEDGHERWQDEYRFRHQAGHYVPVNDRGIILRDAQGRVTRMIGAMTNISERRLMQERLRQAEQIATMGTLSAGIAHEINNPLAITTGLLEQALGNLSRGHPDDTRAMLQGALDGCERIAGIVADLRPVSRQDDGQNGPVDVGEALASALRVTRNEVRHRARLVRDVARVPLVHGSEPRLVQVFVNLLVNAAQAIPDGDALHNEIIVAVRADVDRVIVTIRDTGIGMARATADCAFEPFFTTRASAAGLGLTICRDLLQGMGGEIRLDSTPGQGTVVTVSLRVPSQARRETPRPAPPRASGQRLQVLVIDDEVDLLSVIATTLSMHEVTTAARAAEALAQLRAGRRFDVILCDLMMPDVTGIDFYEEVSRLDPDQALRVGFVTGGAFTPRAQLFLEGHPGRTLEKPFRLQDLIGLVQRLAPTRGG